MSDELIPIGKAPTTQQIVYTAEERAKSAEKTLARTRAAHARSLMEKGQITRWEDLQEKCRIPLTGYHEPEFTYEGFSDYLKQYIEFAGESKRPIMPVEVAPRKWEREVSEIDFGGWRQLPQQEKSINFIVKHFFKDKDLKAILLPLDAGDGKGVIASILAKFVVTKIVEHPMMNHVLIITKKAVKIPMIRKLKRAGVLEDHVGTAITVLSYNDLSSKEFGYFFQEYTVKDEATGNLTKKYKYKGQCPDLVIIDESQVIKKPSSRAFRKCFAFVEAGAKILLTSATPGVTVADMSFFAIASGLKDRDGQVIGKDSWPVLARHIAQPVGREINPVTKEPFTGNPQEPNPKALERFNEYFAAAICRPPRDKMTIKVTNVITTEAMPNIPVLRRIYYEAEKTWLEANRLAGIQVSERGAAMASFQIMRAAAELLMVDIFVDRIKKSLANGHAPVVGVCFQTTLREIVMRCVDQGILKRDEIAVIWGGKRDIKLHEIYGPMEFIETVMKGEAMTKKELAKVKLTREYNIQMCRLNLSVEENELRTKKMRDLGLTQQHEDERQLNMDEFQIGKRKACIFTLSSGGTGIDLDHQDTRSSPRDVYLVTCYYGEEFVQGLGRCVRKGTISDVRQEIIVLAGTITDSHVRPILENKIKSIRTLAAGHMDLVTILEQKATLNDIHEIPPMTEPYFPPKSSEVDATEDIDEMTKMAEEEDDDDEEDLEAEPVGK